MNSRQLGCARFGDALTELIDASKLSSHAEILYRGTIILVLPCVCFYFFYDVAVVFEKCTLSDLSVRSCQDLTYFDREEVPCKFYLLNLFIFLNEFVIVPILSHLVAECS